MAETERGKEIIRELSKVWELESIAGQPTNFGVSLDGRLPVIKEKIDQGEDVWQVMIGLFGVGKSYLSEKVLELFHAELPYLSREGLIGTCDFEEGRDRAITLKAEKAKEQGIAVPPRSLADVDDYNFQFEQVLQEKRELYRLMVIRAAVKTGAILHDQFEGTNAGTMAVWKILRRQPPFDVNPPEVDIDDIVGNYYTHLMAIKFREELSKIPEREVDVPVANRVLAKYGKALITTVEELKGLKNDGAPPYLQAMAYERFRDLVAKIRAVSPGDYAHLEEYSGNDLIVDEELVASLSTRQSMTDNNCHFEAEKYRIWHNDPQEMDLAFFTP